MQLGKKKIEWPIQEALCDFQFQSEGEWDYTILGLFFENVKDRYPKKRQAVGFSFKLEASEKGVTPEIEPAPPRLQFLSRNEKRLIQISKDSLTINMVKPYSSWQRFSSMIKTNHNLYKKIAKPTGINRIGLRYINKFNFKDESIELTDYFNVCPQIPDEVPKELVSFTSRSELSYSDGQDRLLITLSSTKPDEGYPNAIILDFDYIMNTPGAIAFKDVEKWIENAHLILEEIFRYCLTDECRALFLEGV